jgi:thiamine pyrophosphokinase
MKNKIAIIANGTIKNYDFHKKILKDFDIIICADGGANIAKELDIIPNYIIGDFDSIKISVFNHFKKINKTKFIKDADDGKTDLELAINLAETFNPSALKIFGAIGDRIDHTLANIYCLDKISKDISAEIIDDKNTIQLIKKATAIKGEKNDIVSVLPLSDVSNLNYLGFKWNIKNLDTKAGWFGISNKMLGDNASINFSDGKILIVKVRR